MTIVLATMNARYIHTAFGLRYLQANMGDLQPSTRLLEFTIDQQPGTVAEKILAENPSIVGLGIYIWNVELMTELVGILKEQNPKLIVIIGGPEVWYEHETQPICETADYIITGEGDFSLPKLCTDLVAGKKPDSKLIVSNPPDTTQIELPYHLYTDDDVKNRVMYVEASRGCPFTCEFCLSSLDQHLNRFPLEKLLPAFQTLLDRGVNVFKFVDRTFNLSIEFSLKILEFFLEQYRPGLFLHFEMIPDRLPDALKEILACFPRGALQFEVGIQTFNEDVADLISRRQNYQKTIENIRWLLDETGAHIHADLIVGLPGENLASTGEGFDKLLAIGPQEIQVNPLKRLRGTPIIRHEESHGLKFKSNPPYEIIETTLINAATMDELRRFARFWNLYGNSGRFRDSLPMLWNGGRSSFQSLWDFFVWLYEHEQRTYNFALEELVKALWDYLIERDGIDPAALAKLLQEDYQRDAVRDLPIFLRPYIPKEYWRPIKQRDDKHILKRQKRHLA